MIIQKKINRIARAPRISSGIRIEGGGTQNQQCLADGSYYPDRTLVPLVLQPVVSYTDATTGKYVEDAVPELTNGKWYRLTDSNRSLGICDATKVNTATTGTDSNGDQITLFSIVSTPGEKDYGRITIAENVPVDQHITYVFEAILAADGSRVLEFFDCQCTMVAEVPDIEFDNNSTALYDPWHDSQYYVINPSLTIDSYPVVWKWKSFHELEGGWVDLGSTPLDWAIDQVGNGIKIDRHRMQDVVMLQCIAEVTIEGSAVELTKVVTHTRQLPAYEFDITQVGDMTEDVDAIAPYAYIEIKSTGELVTDEKELAIEWLNSSNAVVAHGVNPMIPVSSLPGGIYKLQVRDKGGRAALVHEGVLLTSQGSLILTRSKI